MERSQARRVEEGEGGCAPACKVDGVGTDVVAEAGE